MLDCRCRQNELRSGGTVFDSLFAATKYLFLLAMSAVVVLLVIFAAEWR
jgi:hypothetical protein